VFYCGISAYNNTITRYTLSREEVLCAARKISGCGIKTVVLQSGEDRNMDAGWLEELIRELKRRFDTAVTLSVGERDYSDYKGGRKPGPTGYLLKIETSNRRLYEALHPGMDFKNRLSCLEALKELGYQVGSGCIVGLAGQTTRMLADDIIFFKRHNFGMLGVGPFVPHSRTPLKDAAAGEDFSALRSWHC